MTLFFLLSLFIAALPSIASAIGVPPLSGRVNDYAAMMSPGARAGLERKLKAVEDAESTQIVILTVPSLEGEPIEDFSIRVADAWKIGRAKEDNGVILIVSKNDRKARIEVGYGLEGALTDLQAGRIVRDVIAPAFRSGDYDQGFIQGVDAIAASVRGEYKAPAKRRGREGEGPSLPLVVLILIVLFIYLRLHGGRRGPGPFIFGGPGGGGFNTGGFGGGIGGGGGFSGGGGGFGGGGASGDW